MSILDAAKVPPKTPWLGIISDTHGLLRPEAIQALRGAEQIIHAGDVGDPEILAALQSVAPVTAVRGNVDHGTWAEKLAASEWLEWRDHAFFVLHKLTDLDLDPSRAELSAVVYGHTHQPEIRQRDGILYLNPGSAGPRRFRLPTTVMRVWAADGVLRAAILDLEKGWAK